MESTSSGEFNGCIMEVYKRRGDGVARVCHVDTDTSRPTTKANWEKMVGDKEVEVVKSHSTKGEVLDKVLGKKQKDQLVWSQRLKILCVAASNQEIHQIFVFIQSDGSYKIV
jgi:hypothetical protein